MKNISVVCGAEEPILPNEWLYALNETEMSVGFGRQADSRLNRYSIVWDCDVRTGAAAAADLTGGIGQELGLPLYRVSAWSVPPEATEKQRHVMLTKVAEVTAAASSSGAETYECPDGIVAVVPFTRSSLPLVPPLWKHELILGTSLDPLATLLEADARTFLSRFSWSGISAPNRNVFDWIHREELLLAYRAAELHSLFSLVVITGRRLPVRSWLREGIVSELYEGAEAVGVWPVLERRALEHTGR